MMVPIGCLGLGNTARVLLIASAALLISASMSVGQEADTTKPATKKAIAICTDALKADYGAITLSDVSHLRRSGNRSVYATARLTSGETPRFRCIVRLGTTISRVQVYADGNLSITNSKSGWISATPYRAQSKPDTEVPVETQSENEPKESEVPQENAPVFKAPGGETGFKKPKTQSGS